MQNCINCVSEWCYLSGKYSIFTCTGYQERNKHVIITDNTTNIKINKEEI